MALTCNLTFGGSSTPEYLYQVFTERPPASKPNPPNILALRPLWVLLSSHDHGLLTASCLVILSIYLLVVRHLRFRSIRALERKYGATTEQFKDIDYKDAQSILANLFLLEAPWLFLTSKDFAFLRVGSCLDPRERPLMHNYS